MLHKKPQFLILHSQFRSLLPQADNGRHLLQSNIIKGF